MTSLAVATAAGLCLSAFADNPEKGQSGTLNLTDPVTNASVVASGDTLTTVGGAWNEAPSAEGGYMVIDCDAASSNEFTATSATTGAVVQCDFDLQVAPVPLTARPASAPGAQTAFCVCTNATAGGAAFFCAYVNNDWKQLAGFDVPAADSDYSLRVTFDYKNGKYVKFSVKTTGAYINLYDAAGSASDIWFATGVASVVSGVSQYCFVGTGNVKSFAMAQSAVEAEQIPITPPGGGDPIPMVIPEEAVVAFGGGSAATAATELVKPAANGQTVLENYVVFGQKALDKDITSDTKPVAKIATKADGSGNIPLSFQNLDVKNVPGTSVTYQLMGADTAGGTFTEVGSPVSNAADVKIPSGTTKKVFKVQVNVNYNSANP